MTAVPPAGIESAEEILRPPGPVGRAAELAGMTPRRAALQLAWPGILENLAGSLATTVTFAFAGRLGTEPLAGYGASQQLLFLLFPIWMSLSIGTIALVSRRMGAGRPAEAAEYARQALLIGLGLSVATGAAFALFAEQLVLVLGAEPAVARAARPYLQLVGGANALQTLTFIGTAALRGAGDTRSPLVVTVAGVAVGVPVSYLLLGPLGLVGLAVGYVVANGLSLAITYALLARGRGGLRLGAGAWRPVPAEARALLRISLPASAEQMVWSVGLLIVTVIVLRLGTAAYAAHNVILQVESLSFLPCFGFSVAASALLGQSLGMEDVRRAERSVWATAQPALLWTVLAGSTFVFLPEAIFRIFSADPAVIEAGVPALRTIGFGEPALGVLFVLSGALRGAGDTRFLLKVALGAWLLLRLPAALTFAFVLGWGLVGIWGMFLTDYFVRLLVLLVRFRSRAWAALRY